MLLHLFSAGRYLEVLRRLFEHAFGKLLWPWQSANKTLYASISYRKAKQICPFLAGQIGFPTYGIFDSRRDLTLAAYTTDLPVTWYLAKETPVLF